MASKDLIRPLVVIVGPTASGKTSLSIKLAKMFNGEIISADSRAIYKDMSIGTAKPSLDEQEGVPHWGIDLVSPGEYYTAADYKDYANQKISEIRKRGHVPFLVGGTGLYIDAVIFDYEFTSGPDFELRHKLQHYTVEELLKICEKQGIDLPENHKNKRYLVRSIENNGVNRGRRSDPIENTIVVGISTDKSDLVDRIALRTEQLFEDGVVDEAISLGDKYGWDNEAMKSNIYPLIHEYQESRLSLDEVKNRFKTLDWRLAKRQLTWFRRNKYIKWLNLRDAEDFLISYLASRV